MFTITIELLAEVLTNASDKYISLFWTMFSNCGGY